MNDELQKKLVEYLGSVEKMANDAVLFGKAEIPLYLQELIRWEIVSHAMWAAAFASCAAVSILATVWGWRYIQKNECWEALGALMFPIAAAIGLTIGTIHHAEDAAKAYFAPRVLLVEKLSSMVRK